MVKERFHDFAAERFGGFAFLLHSFLRVRSRESGFLVGEVLCLLG